MDNRFEVTVGAGTMMAGSSAAVRFPHQWTPVVSRWKPISPAGICSTSRPPATSSSLYQEATALGIN